MTLRPVISHWSAVSAFGASAAAFTDGLRDQLSAVSTLPGDGAAMPYPRGAVIPGFSPAAALGKKGTRSMDRVTALAVATVGNLLADGCADLAAGEDPLGLVLGTSNGSLQSIMDFTRDSLVRSRPYDVDPARFPNTVMNCAAGQCGIRYGLRGPNTTIAGGRTAALLALRYAIRMQHGRYAASLLCGAAEEFSDQRCWLDYHTERPTDPRERVLGEGCVIFLVEPEGHARAAGRRPLAEVLGLEFGVHGRHASPDTVLARVITRCLDQAGLRPHDIDTVVPSQPAGELGRLESAALRSALPGTRARWLEVADRLGETSAASAAFQIAALLPVPGAPAPASAGTALVTSVDRDGSLGCALVRVRAGDEADDD
ncbi:beta-ketoacyl synthase N-terminal-like domain-containing protein [Micromonospora sp. NPDC049204]|uniref:beta-ketoacyl synthase N-terminal-like domain-containing protein n=1 Tax=unclassified Micromonospora TaxID=2617518 RepID=UPI0033C98B07